MNEEVNEQKQGGKKEFETKKNKLYWYKNQGRGKGKLK
jgi:hypothetical protein